MWENCVVEQPLFCTYGYNTSVEIIFPECQWQAHGQRKITIGNNVFIAPGVSIITEEHAMDVKQRIEGLEYTHPVTIGDNVWICTGVIVLPGVTIGDNSVIGAGSVVSKDIPELPGGGNPCKVIRRINND